MKTVVIVDDEYIVVKGIQAMIDRNKMDFKVVGNAYDGIEGLRVILEKKPDLVITDIRMPGMDGLSLVEAAKEELPDTIFVIISGYQEFEYARRALQLGIKGYIDKPITIAKVKETMEMATKLLNQMQLSKKKSSREILKKEYQDLSSNLMKYIVTGAAQEGSELLEKTLQVLKQYTITLEEFKEESYKLICLAMGIFFESRSEKKEDQHFPSYHNVENMATDEEVEQFVRELFKSMFQKMEIYKMGSMHRTVEKLLEYINENYNRDIGLTELADKVFLNPAYLSILFKDEVGMSYIKYLTKIRMENAKKLLMEGKKVVEVSEMVGYSNYRYFCDVFKKNEGTTPNEYKGNVRKNRNI